MDYRCYKNIQTRTHLSDRPTAPALSFELRNPESSVCTDSSLCKEPDSSDDEKVSCQPTHPTKIEPNPPPLGKHSVSIGTQTPGSLLDHVQAAAERMSITCVYLKPIRAQFWHHVVSCVKMPAGGVNGRGSMHCSFSFVAANEKVVQFLMEDLPVMQNHRYNLSLPPPHWEYSPSMSTYHALDTKLLDSYFRMHRRLAGKQHRGWYRGSTLAAPPGTHQAPVNLLSVCPPFLVELCHREHGKLVLEVSFNLSIINDLGLQTLPPKMPYALGMDVLFQERAKNHLKRLHHQQAKM